MSNPFSALDLSDDENIIVVKPNEPKVEKKTHHTTHPRGPDAPSHLPRKELEKEKEAMMQKKKNQERRGNVPQPDVPHPRERSKIGLKKEEHVHTHKQPSEGAPRRGRQFDRHSGTGRGKEIKKAGGGGHNWGKAGEDTPVPVTPEPTEQTEIPENTAQETKEEAPTEEPDSRLTLEEYEKLRAQKRIGAAFETKEVRKVAPVADLKVYKKDEVDGEGNYIKLEKEEENKKKTHTSTQKAKPVKQVLEIDYKIAGSTPSQENPRGGRGFGRGGLRGGSTRGAGPNRGSLSRGRASKPVGTKLDTADQSAFPKLGGS